MGFDYEHPRVGGCDEGEILSGTDALHFLSSNIGVGKGPSSTLIRDLFSGLFAKMAEARGDATPALTIQRPPSSEPFSSPRKQRKAYKPQHVVPLVNSSLFSAHKSGITNDGRSLVGQTIPKNSGDSMNSIKGSASDRSMTNMVKGRRNQRQNPHNPTNVCKNLACKAALPASASFCRRCSCHICKEFDDNKDPSLWIICEADGCGLSCHMECALESKAAGVLFTSGCSQSLDGSYFCHPCGQISSLIGLWKRQLLVAKDARRVDVLCLRLFLSYKLLMGTVKYKAAHAAIEQAVKKLDAEVRLFGSTKLDRCLVNRLSCSVDVQKLVDKALEEMEAPTRHAQTIDMPSQEGATSRQASCTLQFDDVCSSSVVVVAMKKQPCDSVFGYQVWHRRATDPTYPNLPTCIIECPSGKALISGLQPLTSYAFKLVPVSSWDDREVYEAECCTQGVEPILGNFTTEDKSDCIQGVRETNVGNEDDLGHGITAVNVCSSAPRFQCLETETPEHCGNVVEGPRNMASKSKLSAVHETKGNSFSEDMQVGPGNTKGTLKSMRNVACGAPSSTLEEQKDNENLFQHRSPVMEMRNDACVPSPMLETLKEDGAFIDSLQHSSLTMELGSQCWGGMEQQQTGQLSLLSKKRLVGVKRAHLYMNCSSDEFPMKVVRWLERTGNLGEEFRMKFLSWYGLKASEHERRVVSVFIDTLQDSPASLATQLVDSFGDIIGSKRQRVRRMQPCSD